MNNYDKVKLQRLINDEHGTNYHRNVPLDGYTITLGDAFISFGFREVNGHVMYITDTIVNVDNRCNRKAVAYPIPS